MTLNSYVLWYVKFISGAAFASCAPTLLSYTAVLDFQNLQGSKLTNTAIEITLDYFMLVKYLPNSKP